VNIFNVFVAAVAAALVPYTHAGKHAIAVALLYVHGFTFSLHSFPDSYYFLSEITGSKVSKPKAQTVIELLSKHRRSSNKNKRRK
jgi:hypothetical protein